MKRSFTEAFPILLNRSGKNHYDTFKLKEKVVSLVDWQLQQEHEVKEVYEYAKLQAE